MSDIQQKYELTIQEENQLENQQEIFAIIKQLDVIEKFYNLDKLDEQVYKNKVSELLQNYDFFKNEENDFDLQKFVNYYQIDCKLALERINQGLQQDCQRQVPLIVDIQNQFHKIDDALQISLATPADEYQILIQDLFYRFQNLQNLSNVLINDIKLQQQGISKILDLKKINTYIDENEKIQIKFHLNKLRQLFNQIINR